MAELVTEFGTALYRVRRVQTVVGGEDGALAIYFDTQRPAVMIRAEIHDSVGRLLQDWQATHNVGAWKQQQNVNYAGGFSPGIWQVYWDGRDRETGERSASGVRRVTVWVYLLGPHMPLGSATEDSAIITTVPEREEPGRVDRVGITQVSTYDVAANKPGGPGWLVWVAIAAVTAGVALSSRKD